MVCLRKVKTSAGFIGSAVLVSLTFALMAMALTNQSEWRTWPGLDAAMVATASTLYIGGSYGAQACDPLTGNPKWNLAANGEVHALAKSGSIIYIGGYFTSLGGQVRNRVAAFDEVNRTVTPWNPNVIGGEVLSLKVSGSIVYAGGDFSKIGGENRNRLAALDINTGAATSWNPDVNGPVLAMVVSGSTLYIGGEFTQVGGQPRNRIAAFDMTTGALTPWNPDANGTVYCLDVSGSTVYAGGAFTRIGGQARAHIAALDTTIDTANATPWAPDALSNGSWDPNSTGSVYAMSVWGNQILVTGDFGTIGGVERNALASLFLDKDTDNATNWNPFRDVDYHWHAGYCLTRSSNFMFCGGTCLTMFSLYDHTLSIEVNPPDAGTVEVDPLPGPDGYDPGTLVTLTAVRNPGYAFNNWSGNYASSANPGTVEVLGHKLVIADFRESRGMYLEGNLNYGQVPINTSVQRTLKIYNDEFETLTVSSINYPGGFTGAWSGQIAPYGSQSVAVTFLPTAHMTYGGTVTVNADFTRGENTIEASGTGISRTIRLIADWNFNSTPINTTSVGTLAIWNDGNVPLTVTSINYPNGFTGSWYGQIPAGTCQAVPVLFAPTALQSYGGTITVNSDKSHGVNTIPISGVGAMPVTRMVRLVGDLAFGSITVNTTAQRSFKIHNDGGAPLTVSGLSYPAGFSGNWSGQIAPGMSQTIFVTFAPALAQAYGGNVTVNCDSTSGLRTIATSGQGTPVGVRLIRLTGALDCRYVLLGETARRTLVIRNDGTSPLTVNAISLPEGYTGSWSGDVAPGGLQAVEVFFTPTAVQLYEGNITVSSNATGGTNTIGIIGRGTTEKTRVIRLEGDLAFGQCTAHVPSERTMTIHNDGTMPMVIDSISYPHPFYGAWIGEIGPGDSHDITVVFIPDENQAYSGVATVNSDVTGGINTIAVSGTTLPESRIIRLTGDMAFDSVPVNTTAERTLTIHNDGNTPLTVNSIGYPNTFTGAWSGTVAPGESQAVTVTFAPTAAQTYSGNISINCNRTSGTHTCAVSGTGTETVTEITATISNVWWSDEVDTDNDGYHSAMKLWCKSDVSGGQGSLTVFEKVYWRASGTKAWTLCRQTTPRTITGTNSNNAIGAVMTSKVNGTYDYKVEVYRGGQSTPDHVLDSSTSAVLSAYPEELSNEEIVSGPSCAGSAKTTPTTAGLKNSAADLIVLGMMLLFLTAGRKKQPST